VKKVDFFWRPFCVLCVIIYSESANLKKVFEKYDLTKKNLWKSALVLILKKKGKLCTFFGIFILVIFGFVGCDVCCDTCGNSGSNGEYDIFFTASEQNSDVPAIFSISSSGNNLKRVIDSGIIYSAPSKNGYIAYLNTVDNIKVIMTAKVDGSTKTDILSELRVPGNKITYPILSPDGKWIAFIGRDDVGRYKSLMITDNTGGVTFRISRDLLENTLPVFSPDGSMVAFYEDLSGTIGIRVLYSDPNNSNSIFSANLGYGIDVLFNKQPTISWTEDSKSIVYAKTTETEGKIYIKNIFNNEADSLDVGKLGAIYPDISPLAINRVAFTSRDGVIWTRSLNDSLPDYQRITESDSTEKNYFAQWSPDGKKILYNNYNLIDDAKYGSTILIANIGINNVNTLVLSNKVDRCFWRK
jgi:Tol biopolymer transport system component